MKRYIYCFIVCSQLIFSALAHGEFIIAFTKDINETFPEIKKVFSSLSKDDDAPLKIEVFPKTLDSKKMMAHKVNLLERENVHVIIGQTSSLALFSDDEDFILYPPNPNTFSSHFIFLRSETVPTYLWQFNDDNVIFYKQEYHLDLYFRLLEKCYFKDPSKIPSIMTEDKNKDRSDLYKKTAILIKACGQNPVYPSDYYWQFHRDTLATVLPTIYFEPIKVIDNQKKISCLNEKSALLRDNPNYVFNELMIAEIFDVLEKLQLAERYSRDFNSIQTITREEKIQLVFITKYRDKVIGLMDYLRHKYNMLKDFYFEQKGSKTKEKLNAFSKTLYLLSSNNNIDSQSAIADVYYRRAREMHRAWNRSQNGVHAAIVYLTTQANILDDTNIEKLVAVIKAYDMYLNKRPKSQRADIYLLYSINNQALSHLLAHYHYYNRGNCSKNSLSIKDCVFADNQHKKYKELKKEILSIVTLPQNDHIKGNKWYGSFKKIFESNFQESLPD